MSKLFNTDNILPVDENMDHQTLFNAIEEIVLIDQYVLQDFLNCELHPLMFCEITQGILNFPPESYEEKEFRNIFERTMIAIIAYHSDLMDNIYYPDFDNDYEEEAEYANNIGAVLTKSINHCLKCYIDDLVIAGMSLQYVGLKDNEPELSY